MNTNIEPKKCTNGFSAEKMDAIFHHPDCFKMFGEHIDGVRLQPSKEGMIVGATFERLLFSIPYTALNLTLAEFNQFINARDCDCHTGIVLKMVSLIENAKPIDFLPKANLSTQAYSDIINACATVKDEINALITPIRDKVIEEFWLGATLQQQNEVNAAVKNMGQMRTMPGLAQKPGGIIR